MKSKKHIQQQLQQWQSFCAEVQRGTKIELNETDAERKKRIDALLKDYASFVAYYFPHYAKSAPAKFHLQAANKIAQEPKLRAVFEWARGHAKSVTFDIMIPLWLKAKKQMKVMVLVGKSQEAAITLLSDLQAELQHNQRYLADFGNQIAFGDWQQGNFATLDGCAFFAKGRGQSPRGLRKKEERPDYIVIDDLDDDELVENPARVQKMVDWIKTALFGAMDMGRGRFIMVGNRIHKNSVLANLASTKGIFHSKVNATDSKGKPAWAEKYTKEEIKQAINFIGDRAAQKEFFNNPVQTGSVFKKKWLQFKPMPHNTLYNGIVAYCDPSFKANTKADYKAVAVLGKPKNSNELHLLDVFVKQCSITTLVEWFYQLHETATEQNRLISYFMEATFMQDLIFEDFQKEGNKRGYQLPIRGDMRSKPDKFQRIESISPFFERGSVWINQAIKNSADWDKAQEQLLSIEKGSRFPDDFPDALEGAVWQLQHISRLQSAPAPMLIKRVRKNAY